MSDQTPMLQTDGVFETTLDYWARTAANGSYVILPKVARIIFALPSSSAQIERDFGNSGQMVTSQRSSLLPHNIDMCSFLNRNRAFVVITQCERINDDDLLNHIPSNVLVDFEGDVADVNEILLHAFPESDYSDEVER